MKLQNKTIYSLIAAALALLGFFFSFATFSYFGYGFGSISGFSCAFSFSGATFLAFFALLAGIAGVVLVFMHMDFFSNIAYYAAAALLLIFAIAGSVSGFGLWWSLIFFIAAGSLGMFGSRFPLPAIDFGKIKDAAAQMQQKADQQNVQPQDQPQGQPAANASFCPNCGTKVSADTRFCPNCGAKL